MKHLKKRFFESAVNIAMLTQKLPQGAVNNAYINQLVRCSSSPAANYLAALRGKSTKDFVNKPEIAEEELDESLYFLRLLHYFNPDERSECEILTEKPMICLQ